VKEIKEKQKEMNKSISSLDSNMATRFNDLATTMAGSSVVPPVDLKSVELAIADIQPVAQSDNSDSIYLPLGSFCKGTLLTGVYAAADQNNPLPVLIVLEEAFHGPNKTRIPLKGAFVLGKAYGDLVSQRALIQIIGISSMLPNSVTFEHEENLGYVTDAQGELGIRGELIRNTGSQLALSFMGGFMSGGSQALADQEVSERRDGEDHLVKEVTGNQSKHALFSGLAQSAGKLSEYYAKQAEDLVPAIHVRNGQSVYFIVQKGVKIDGLSRVAIAANHYVD
jgi:hypothetical protein